MARAAPTQRMTNSDERRPGERSNARLGMPAGVAMSLLAMVSLAIAVATPPLSGPLCKAGCLEYPFTGLVSRFPRDYVWMVPAILFTLPYVGFVIALEGRAAPEGRPYARLGVALSVMSALVLVGDYFVQLAAIQPSALAGETDGIPLLTQYNPHGLFIALEELGYVLMSVSLLCMVPAFSPSTTLERAVRWIFLGGFIVNSVALFWFVGRYGHDREYFFEIATISVNWIVLIASGFSAAAIFRRDLAGLG
jgi:hypothetical protein